MIRTGRAWDVEDQRFEGRGRRYSKRRNRGTSEGHCTTGNSILSILLRHIVWVEFCIDWRDDLTMHALRLTPNGVFTCQGARFKT